MAEIIESAIALRAKNQFLVQSCVCHITLKMVLAIIEYLLSYLYMFELYYLPLRSTEYCSGLETGRPLSRNPPPMCQCASTSCCQSHRCFSKKNERCPSSFFSRISAGVTAKSSLYAFLLISLSRMSREAPYFDSLRCRIHVVLGPL